MIYVAIVFSFSFSLMADHFVHTRYVWTTLVTFVFFLHKTHFPLGIADKLLFLLPGAAVTAASVNKFCLLAFSLRETMVPVPFVEKNQVSSISFRNIWLNRLMLPSWYRCRFNLKDWICVFTRFELCFRLRRSRAFLNSDLACFKCLAFSYVSRKYGQVIPWW